MPEHQNVTHCIKLTSRFVRPVLDGRKRFEVRDDDRHYEVGDTVIFRTVDESWRGFAESEFRADYYVPHGWGVMWL